MEQLSSVATYIVGGEYFRWLVFAFCGLQMMDYWVMNSFVLDEEELERVAPIVISDARASRIYVFRFSLSQIIGMIANLIVMVCAALQLYAPLPYAVPVQIAACLYNVAKMDVRALFTLSDGGPREMFPMEYATCIMMANCLRLFTSWIVYEYWCLMQAAAAGTG